MRRYRIKTLQAVFGLQWDLGDVYIDESLDKDLSRGLATIEDLLFRHLDGDYGELQCERRVIDAVDNARARGEEFSSVFAVEGRCIKIATCPDKSETRLSFVEDDFHGVSTHAMTLDEAEAMG